MENEIKSDKKFVEYIERKVRKTIRVNKLFTRKDKLAVAVSGGKDSTTVLYILHKIGYDLEAVTIDASIGNYTKINKENLIEVCKKYKIPLKVISFREEFGKSLCYLKSVLKSKGHEFSSCMLCGILKRYLLNRYVRKKGFDYLITGHNHDDEAQAFLMNVFRNDFRLAVRQGPKPGIVSSKGFVQRAKPLYNVSEAEVVRYSKIMKFPVNFERCPCSSDAYRRQFIKILDDFEKKHPSVKHNVLKFQESLSSVAKIASKDMPKAEVNVCDICGEPSSGRVCKTCKIFELLDAR